MNETWDPAAYLSFEDHRLRPALELIARVPQAEISSMVDLGCGTGNVAAPLLSRWPNATYTGVDSSPEMLGRARDERPELSWVESDMESWSPDSQVDLVYSNAALHWLDRHEVLFPRLLDHVSEGGALAVQMPNNFDQPTHTCIAEAVASQDWSADLNTLLRSQPVHDPTWYYDVLAPLSSNVDIWSTTYLQPLSGPDPIVTWTSGSVLRPILSALPEVEQKQFLSRYRRALDGHYAMQSDGKTVLAFTRLFIVATSR